MADTHTNIAKRAGRDRALGELDYLTPAEIAALDTADMIGPLSGEWAGDSVPEISGRVGVDLWQDHLATAYEDSYWQAIGEAIRRAQRI